MTPTGSDAVNILAFLASRDPESFRSLVRGAVGRECDDGDWVTIAEGVAADVAALMLHSPEAELSERFARHLEYVGKTRGRAAKRAEFVRLAALGLGAEAIDAAARGDDAALASLRALAARHADEAVEEILASWGDFREDLLDAEAVWDSFAFDVLGGADRHPSFRHAALLAGGAESSAAGAEIVLGEVPFSAFVAAASGTDPAVFDILADLSRRRGTTAFLLRVDWTVADRLRLKPKAYENLIRAALPDHEVRSLVVDSERCLPMRGRDLFLGAARKWSRPFRELTLSLSAPPIGAAEVFDPHEESGRERLAPDAAGRRFMVSGADRIQADYPVDPRAALVPCADGLHQRALAPREIARLLGLDPAIVDQFPIEAEAYALLCRSAAVPVVDRVLRGFLRAVDLV